MDNNTFKITDSSSSFQNNSPSFIQWVKSISIYTWLLFFVVLFLLGFNIFIYLEKVKQSLKYGFKYISNILNPKIAVSKEEEPRSHKEEPVFKAKEKEILEEHEETQQRDIMKNNPLNLALNENSEYNHSNKEQVNEGDYQADDSRSFLNSRKEGWCFIGENNGARVCGEVGLNDECMSGQIFPSSELCVNPNLRV